MSTTTIDLPKSKYELEFNQGSVYEQEERDAVLRVLAANAPSCGSEVLAFEKEFSNFVGATFGIAVGNATQGLELAVRAALSLSRNEVVVPAVSWISTASAAALAGAVVRFADVAAPSVCVDVEAVKRLCNEKTAAVIVVHLYGRPVDGVLELAEWLKSRHIALIEDCAHSVGATIRGRQTGSVGDIGVFSFHQQKNMVTLGEGGLVVTSSPELREKMVGFRSLNAKSYDPKGKYLALDATRFPMDHRFWMMDFGDYGSNFRMTDMQAAVGREQLKKLARFNARRRAIAHRLHSELSSVRSLRLPELDSDVIVHSWHVFHILLTAEFPLSKEEFMWSMLKDFGVKVWNHYAPMHLASCFRLRQIGKRGDCPNAEALFEQYVSLPIHPRLSDEAVAHMINAVKSLSLRPNQDVRPSLVDKLLELSETRASESHFDQASQFETFLRQNSSELFSSSSVIVTSRAPGRLDLMGGNGDYSGSMVIQCTIKEATFCAAQMNDSGVIRIRNLQLSERDFTIAVSDFSRLCSDSSLPTALVAHLSSPPSSFGRWPLYVVGVLWWLQTRRQVFDRHNGISLFIWSDVPLGKGVSSSASVEIACMKAAAEVLGVHDLRGVDLATACQLVEIQVCGSACGIMDQLAVTLGSPFMAMLCQPARLLSVPSFAADLCLFAVDSGVAHQVSGLEYEAARAAAFMGYKMICKWTNNEIRPDSNSSIPRFCDDRFNGYLANISASQFASEFEERLPVSLSGREFLAQFGSHVDPATRVIPDHIYRVRSNARYGVLEHSRVSLFHSLLHLSHLTEVRHQLGELMFQSHFAYSECGLGCDATTLIVELVRAKRSQGLFGAKMSGGGAGGTVVVLGLQSARPVFEEVVAEYARRANVLQPHVFVGASDGADAYGLKSIRL